MILCSCSVLTSDQIAAAVQAIVAEDPLAVITPGRLFHRCGKKLNCARCASLVDQEACRLRQACAECPRPLERPEERRPA